MSHGPYECDRPFLAAWHVLAKEIVIIENVAKRAAGETVSPSNISDSRSGQHITFGFSSQGHWNKSRRLPCLNGAADFISFSNLHDKDVVSVSSDERSEYELVAEESSDSDAESEASWRRLIPSSMRPTWTVMKKVVGSSPKRKCRPPKEFVKPTKNFTF